MFNGVVPDIIREEASELIKFMCQAEKRWTKYITRRTPNFSSEQVDIFIEGQANSVCSNLGIPYLYEKVSDSENQYKKILVDHLPNDGDITGMKRGAVFEGNIDTYAKDVMKNDLP